jgi:hypothetical protein
MLLRPALTAAAFLPLILLAACGGAPPGAHGPASAWPVPSPAGPNAKAGESAAALPGSGSGLKGLSATQVRTVLGSPAIRRRDAPAEIWQYRGHACTLDVFLYDETGGPKVAHTAVRSASGVSDRDCVDELTAKAKGVPTS